MSMHDIPGGVTAARGFRAACCAAGIKYQGRADMAMLVSSVPCAVAGTFTSNRVKAAPVIWDQRIVYENGQAQAVVVNAGIANAATGDTGMALCAETAAFAFGKDLGEDFGRFDGDVLVDENNAQASKSEIEAWKSKERKLWNCHLRVYLEVRAVREFTLEDAEAF